MCLLHNTRCNIFFVFIGVVVIVGVCCMSSSFFSPVNWAVLIKNCEMKRGELITWKYSSHSG